MNAIVSFAVVSFLAFQNYAAAFDITTPTGEIIGKFRLRGINYETSLTFYEKFPKTTRYGIYVHGKGSCKSYDPFTLVSILLIDPLTGRRISGYDPKEYFLIPGAMEPGSKMGGSIRYHPGYNLETDLSEHVITLQEVGTEGKPSGRVLSCWVY